MSDMHLKGGMDPKIKIELEAAAFRRSRGEGWRGCLDGTLPNVFPICF